MNDPDETWDDGIEFVVTTPFEHPRYEPLGELGSGGMGTVYRVWDRTLGRAVALKVMKTATLSDARATARFIEEAQIGAQLQHPNLVPVYDLGTLHDGRHYFTMREIAGRTFADLVHSVHTVSSNGWESTEDGWTLRRLVEVITRAAEAVGFAHRLGVVHRDLKPANVMVGDDGEVLVVDWGLAKAMEALEPPPGAPERGGRLFETLHGSVYGTPAFMPPEQARGELITDARGDVYALGAILFFAVARRPPVEGKPDDVVAALSQGQVPDVRAVLQRQVPAQLVELCAEALSADPQSRPPDGGAFAEALRRWLDGTARRQQSHAHVLSAIRYDAEANRLRSEAGDLRAEAHAATPAAARETAKAAVWALEDRATNLERAAEVVELRVEEQLRAAVFKSAELEEAHAMLAARYRAAHEEAERSGDRRAMNQTQSLLRTHAEALSVLHPDRPGLLRYLRGDGALTAISEPPARAVLLKYVERRRRLVAEPFLDLGSTPVFDRELARGRFLLRLSAPGHETVDCPVHIERLKHSDNRPPDGAAPRPLRLPVSGTQGREERYVPGGWYLSGGDPAAANGLARTPRWVEPFFCQRVAVTNGDYLQFLNALAGDGRHTLAAACAPGSSDGKFVPFVFADGRYALGEGQSADWPVVLVDLNGARTYAQWFSARTGSAWRLPTEFEWEKSARGVDGRLFPWGDWFDADWCRSLEGARRPAEATPCEVGCYPVDVSPYGIQDLAGNAQSWCDSPFDLLGAPTPHVVVRGGSWFRPAIYSRAASRRAMRPNHRDDQVGFRLVRSAL